MKQWLKSVRLAVAAIGLAAFVGLPALAFDKDAHYYLKYALARKIGYSTDDAQKIASADQAVDEDDDTKAGALTPQTNKDYHAFGTKEENDARREVLKLDFLLEQDRDKKLAKLGILLHFVEDIYAHQGYGSWFGHGWDTFWGDDPDSLANDLDKTLEMVKDSLEVLKWAAGFLGVTPVPVDSIWNDPEFIKMLGRLIANSRTDWYSPFSSGSKDRIINGNRRILEGYLGEAIPEPMVVKYDENGEPIKIGPIEYVPIDPWTYQSDLVVTDMFARLQPVNRVRVEVSLLNRGTEPSLEGWLTVMTFDLTSGALVAQQTLFLDMIDAGQTDVRTFTLSAAPQISNTYIAADLDVDDRDASNGDWFFWYGPVATDKLSDLKTLPAGPRVSITDYKVATVSSATFSDCSWYIEEPTRASGIKVVGNPLLPAVAESDSVELTGAMREDANGEKYVAITSIDSKVSHAAVDPLGVVNRGFSATGGLLVKTWGRVTAMGTGYFLVDDGSGTPVHVIFDGLILPIGQLPVVGQYVAITGPSGLIAGETDTMPAIRPRGQSDIRRFMGH